MRPTGGRLFWTHVEPQPNGCWVWTARKDADGYGRATAGSARVRAHRQAYEWIVGLIPAGLSIDHLCRNKACVNPSHMEPVTNGENVRRARHCADPTHQQVIRKGIARCRDCQNAYFRQRYRTQREALRST